MVELVLYVVRDDSVTSSLRALTAAETAAPALRQNGVRLTVIPVRPREMAAPAVRSEFADFGITILPALVRVTDGNDPELVAERCDAVAAALDNEVRQQRAQTAAAKQQSARSSRANLGDPQEYREFVRTHIGSKDDGDGNETGEGDFKTQQAAAMRKYMERRKALGMDTKSLRPKRNRTESPQPAQPRPSSPARSTTSRTSRRTRQQQAAGPQDHSMSNALQKAEQSGNVPADDAMMMGVWLANQETT